MPWKFIDDFFFFLLSTSHLWCLSTVWGSKLILPSASLRFVGGEDLKLVLSLLFFFIFLSNTFFLYHVLFFPLFFCRFTNYFPSKPRFRIITEYNSFPFNSCRVVHKDRKAPIWNGTQKNKNKINSGCRIITDYYSFPSYPCGCIRKVPMRNDGQCAR